MNQPSATLFFDGHCPLCCGWVQFILNRDRTGYFQFAPINGTKAKELFTRWKTNSIPDSIVLDENGQFFTRSTAALRIARKLSGAWPLLYVFIVIPAPIRDFVYNSIARNRFRWFGRHEACWIPKQEWQERFLD